MADKLKRIGDTPVSISVYSVEKTPTYMHERGILEIIFCLKGSVRFSYAYEEFTLHAGEYVSVDADAYYLYDGKDNVCVSIYFDLRRYMDRFPFIYNNLFICEGFAESTMEYPTPQHNRLRGMIIAMLRSIAERGDVKIVEDTAGEIISLFIEHFDVCFFHADKQLVDSGILEKMREINDYLHNNMSEKLTVGELARRFNFTEGYMSEYMRKISIGFRGMVSYIRANESERYLLTTDKTILEISEACGFSDVKYYYSAFKRWYKCTPRQFREQYGRASEEKITYLNIEDVRGLIDELLISHYMETFLPKKKTKKQ